MDGFKKLPKYKAGGLIKTPVTGDKKAKAPSEATKRPSFKGSDVEKEKSKPSGHRDPYIKSKEEKQTADFPSAAVKGRNKKDAGTVNKYKAGGNVTNVYEAKKKAGDKDNIQKVKDIKPVKLCGGKSVRKYANGGGVLDAIKGAAVDLKEKVMGTPEQNRLALEREKRIAARKAAEASGNSAMINAQPAPTAPLPGPGINAGAGNPATGSQDAAVPGGMKKGGKAKRKC